MRMNDAGAENGMTLFASADLQDHLLTVTNDLGRLQLLLDDCHASLQAGFLGLFELLPDRNAANAQVASTVKALQFQDLASQLISHASRRLRNCADQLAQIAFAGDGDGDAVLEHPPLRANPVTQSEMDTGFIELF
jgi:hypothetical protein